MKKRAKHAPKSLTSSEVSIRVVIAGVILLLFFFVAIFLNRWYLYSHFNTPETITTFPPKKSPPNPAIPSPSGEEDALPKVENDTNLTFYDRLTGQESANSNELSVPPSTSEGVPATSQPQSPLQSDQTNATTSPTNESPPEIAEDVPEDLSYTVQVGSFQSLEHAEKILALLKEQGFEASITSVNLSGGNTWYRVRIGKFPIREEADKVAQKLKENGSFQPMIMPFKKTP
ncbi:MAG: SPOR domain-containing protein [Pseudomonadota bacterium]